MADVQTQKSPKSIGLTSDSFHNLVLSPPERRRTIAIVMGTAKSGKTDWCLRHLPDPIIVYNFDNGLEGMVEKFQKRKTIIVAGMPITPEMKKKGQRFPSYHFARPIPKGNRTKDPEYVSNMKKTAIPVWERFIKDYVEGLESQARSLVIDTGGAAFQLAKFAFIGMDKYGSKDDPYGQKGGEMKSIFQGLITDGLNYDKNVIWIHREAAVWKGGEPTNEVKNEGYAGAPYEVQFTLRIKRKQAKVKNVVENSWTGEIRDCRLGKGAKNNGLTFGGEDEPDLDFASVMTTLLPDTKEEEWVA